MTKIRVTASRRDDVLRRKAEYETSYNERKSRFNTQSKEYAVARDHVFADVEDAIRSELGNESSNLGIDVTTNFNGLLSVKITSERGRLNRSLSWSWYAQVSEDGSVMKESNSWSGLEATTLDQIEDLKQSVRQLEAINKLDWAYILNQTLPEYGDYVTEADPSWDRDIPDFDKELIIADIEDSVGQPVLIKAYKGSGRFYNGEIYYGIVRDSGSQYTVFEVHNDAVQSVLNGTSDKFSTVRELLEHYSGNTYRIKKSTLIDSVFRPLQIVNY